MTTLLWVTLLAFPAQQENGRPQGPYGKPTPKSAWDWEWRSRGEFAYDNNIWLLENDGQDRLRDHERGGPTGTRPADDETSGRYDDMETADDFIFMPSLRWDGNGPSPFGRRFDIGIGLEIPTYLQNTRRSYLEFDLGIGQQVGSRGHLGLNFQFVPEYFRKNYLADAQDLNTNGNISANERIYEDGTYREWEGALEYRHKLIDRTQNQPFGLTGTLELSYTDRSYDSSFSYRDEQAMGILMGLRFQYGPRIHWGLSYQYVASDSPSKQHVVLVNENALGTDVNGDFFLANNARTIQTVDRTHTEHEIGISVGVELSDKFEVEVVYERLLRDFDSGNRFDVEHFGREDQRDSVEMVLLFKVTKAWNARLGYLWRQQESDLDDPDAGDDGDYDRDVFYASVTYSW